MSTEPISKERLDAIVAEYHDAAVLAGKCNPDEMVGMTSAKVACQLFSDVATALRDYARLREENVEADARRYRWLRDDEVDRAFLPQVTQYKKSNSNVSDSVALYGHELDAAIDSALQGPRHE